MNAIPSEPPMWIYGAAVLVMLSMWLALVVVIERAKLRNKTGRKDGQTNPGENDMTYTKIGATLHNGKEAAQGFTFEFPTEESARKALTWLSLWAKDGDVPPPIHRRRTFRDAPDPRPEGVAETDQRASLQTQIDALRTMVVSSVHQLSKNWDAVRADLRALSDRVTDAEKRAANMDQNILAVDNRRADLGEQVRRLKWEVANHDARATTGMPEHNSRLDRLEHNVNRLIAAVVGEGSAWPLKSLQTQLREINAANCAASERINAVYARVSALHEQVAKLRHHADTAADRIARLEVHAQSRV